MRYQNDVTQTIEINDNNLKNTRSTTSIYISHSTTSSSHHTLLMFKKWTHPIRERSHVAAGGGGVRAADHY